jgi:hypothetical protein
VPRPGYWPPSVITTGFWLQTHLRSGGTSSGGGDAAESGGPAGTSWQLPDELIPYLDASKHGSGSSIDQQPVILIDFGSMGRLGFLNNHHRLLAVLLYILDLAEM